MNTRYLFIGLAAVGLTMAAPAYDIPPPPYPHAVVREAVDDLYTEATHSEGTRRAAMLCASALGNMALGEQAMAADNSAALAREFPKSPFTALLSGGHFAFPCMECFGVKTYERCAQCRGSGQREMMRGTPQKCLQCAGRGVVAAPCRACNGRGVDRVSPLACAILHHELAKGIEATPGPVGQSLVNAALAKLDGARRVFARAERLAGTVNGQDATGVVLELTLRATRETFAGSTDIAFLKAGTGLDAAAPGARISVFGFRDGKCKVTGVFGEVMEVDAYRLDPWPADEDAPAPAPHERVRGVPVSVFRLVSEDAKRRFPEDAAAREREISRLLEVYESLR